MRADLISFALLLVLASNAGRVMSRDAIMEAMKNASSKSFDRRSMCISRAFVLRSRRRQEAAAHHHRAWQRLRIRQGSGFEGADAAASISNLNLTIIASLLLVVLVAGGVWRMGHGGPQARRCSRSRRDCEPGAAALDRAATHSNVPSVIWRALPQRSCALHSRWRAARRSRRPLPVPPLNTDGEWLRGPGGRLGVPPAGRPPPGGAGLPRHHNRQSALCWCSRYRARRRGCRLPLCAGDAAA